MTSLRLLVVWLLAVFAAAQETPWLVVRDDNGAWITLKEVSPRSEFWLRPEATLEPTSQMSGCGSGSRISVEVRLWSAEQLAAATRALRTQGRCGSSCRVLPFMVERLGLRDQRSQWRTADRWLFVSGPVPATQRFDLDRVTSVRGDAHCRPSSLVLEMVVAGERTSTSGSQTSLVFTSADVQWAAGVLRLRRDEKTLTRSRLRQLARKLLTSKLKTLEAVGERFSMGITPSVLRKTELALVVRTESADSNSTRSSQPLFLLKNLSTLGTFRILMPAASSSSGLTRISLRDPRRGGQMNIPSLTSPPPTSGSSSKPSPYLAEKFEALRSQVKALESLVRDLLNKTDNRSVASLLGNRPLKGVEPTPPPPSAPVVGDCAEVKSRGLGGGVFLLRPTGRAVRCTDKGELVALDRSRGNVDFNRDWADYRDGFGDPSSGDYWVGLRYLAKYTGAGDRCMQLLLKPWRLGISERRAQYASFAVDPEAKNFRVSYAKFRGDVAQDGFKLMNGQAFSTRDRDNDAFVGNCANVFGGGNWYKSCSEANIFGRHKYLDNGKVNTRLPQTAVGDPMCWKGLVAGQGSMCFPLVAVRMLLSRADKLGTGRRVVYSQIAPARGNCRSELKRFTVSATGTYHITLGGGAGGQSSDSYFAPGGRGALVRATMLLRRGQKLAIVAGCGGSRGMETGHGGNATWLVDDKRWTPILVAGGGGGAGRRLPGMHGRAEESRGRAWWVRGSHLSPQYLLHPSPLYRGYNWSSCHRTNTTCTTGRQARLTIMKYRHRGYPRRYRTVINSAITGGGGGGGFEGSPSGTTTYAAGGGGSSFCDMKLVTDCSKEEGGNFHQVGFLIMEKPVCF